MWLGPLIFIISGQKHNMQRDKKMKNGWAGVVCTVQFLLLTQTVMQKREFLNNPEQCRCFFYIITPGFGMVHCLKSSVAIELALPCRSNHHMQIPCTSCKDTAPCQQGSSPMVGQGELSWKSEIQIIDNAVKTWSSAHYVVFFFLFLLLFPKTHVPSTHCNLISSQCLIYVPDPQCPQI